MAWQLNANSRRHANHIEFIQLHFVASFIVCLSDHPLRLDVRPLRRVYWRHFRTEETKVRPSHRLATLCIAAFLTLSITASAQWQKKPYGEWSEKEVLNVLDSSPWGQTQTVTDTTNMVDTGRRVDSGQSRVAEVPQIRFHIRFFSAKP